MSSDRDGAKRAKTDEGVPEKGSVKKATKGMVAAAAAAAKKQKKMHCAIILSGRRETSSAQEDWSADDGNCDRLQKAVGGHFEMLFTAPGLECYVNEEGLITQLPQNESAAYALEKLGMRRPGLIWGPAVLVFSDARKYADFKKTWFDLYLKDELPEDD